VAWRDLAACCKLSEQTPNHCGEKRKKYGEIKRESQMFYCRLILIILEQGVEKKKYISDPDVWRKRLPRGNSWQRSGDSSRQDRQA